MTTPTIPSPGEIGSDYEIQIDVDMNYQSGGLPDWYQLAFITNVADPNTKELAETTTNYNRGAKAQKIVGEEWSLTFDHQVQRTAMGLYIPTLAVLVEAAKFGQRDKAARAHVRWYDTEGSDYAFDGVGYVQMTRGTGKVATYGFTITSDGAATAITNPFAQPLPTVPEVTSVSPSGQGTGDLVTIKGARFTGTTAVTFDSIAASQFAVSDSGTIVAELPSDDAGAVDVEVTTPAGTSTAFPYTRAS